MCSFLESNREFLKVKVSKPPEKVMMAFDNNAM